MSEKIIYQDKHVVIKHLVEARASMVAWSSFPTHEKYKTIMEKTYDLIKQANLLHWISDQKGLKTLSTENQKWVNEYFIPKVLSTTSIRKVAIIVGKDVFTQAAMGRIREKLEAANLPIQYFEHISEVEAWLNDSHA